MFHANDLFLKLLCAGIILGLVSCDRSVKFQKKEISEKVEKTEQKIEEKDSDKEDGTFYGSLIKLNIPDEFKLKDIVIGNEQAPQTLVIYSSFTCNHCHEFHTELFEKFKKNYIDTGKVKIILRQYLDDVGALEAAILVRCLCKNNANAVLDAYHQIFENQKEWMHSKEPQKFLKNLFVKQGYSADSVEQCLVDKKIPAGLMKEQQRAMQQLHIFSVPVFINENGKMHIGKITYEELEGLISKDKNA